MIFIDTGGWYALSDPQDQCHGSSVEFFRELARGKLGRALTSDYILDETLTLVRMRLGLGAVADLFGVLERSKFIQLVRVADRDFQESLQLMLQHEDKRWSFTDCTSFVLMRELGVQIAMSFDSNFREAGFECLPNPID